MNELPYALRVLAGRDPGVEFPLEDYDREILIGRADDVDLVLDDARVSRKHARMFVEHGRLFIEDLGSTNGIFVNAKRVWLSALNEGDRIQIGASLLKLVTPHQIDSSRLERTDLFFPPEAGDEELATAPPRKDPQSRFSGVLEEIPILDLVQLLSTSKKSGVLEIHGEQQGSVYLRNGQVSYARIGELPALSPHKAFYRILSWKTGQFELLPAETQPFEGEMKESTDVLLLEAMRQLDEIARMQKLLPPPDVHLAVAGTPPPLRKLNPEQTEVLKIIYSAPQVSVGTIVDTSPLPDLETYLALIHLVRARYVGVAK